MSSYREGDSQGEDRMTGNSFRSKNEELDAKSLEAAVMSVCPFCAKALPRGNDLSRHLLQCSSRRKSKQRREVASLGEAGSPTPIQVLSASGEGRQLPGHPKPKTTST